MTLNNPNSGGMTLSLKTLILAGLTLGLAPRPAAADGTNAALPTARESNTAKAADLHGRQTKEFGANTNYLVRPGLLADRAGRRVTVVAESIHLGAGSPVEFPLISENSGKDYEAFAVSFAKPSDLHAALTFIGLPAGRSTEASRLRFWPKGERVKVTFHYTEMVNGKPLDRVIPAERLVLDSRTGKTLPETGFVFVGSSWMPSPDSSQTGLVYAADVFSPNSMVSLYNESGTVLDVPRRAAQHEVYSYQIPNPALPLPTAQFIEVVIEPERNDGHLRVCELTLEIVPGAPGATLPGASPAYVVHEAGGTPSTNTTLKELAGLFEKIMISRRDPFVTLQPDDTLTLDSIRTAAALLDTLENKHEVRIEPPPAGHPYYRAFLPDEKHRERANRPIQPWELNLARNNGVVTGELVRLDEEWKGDDTRPTYREHHFAVASAASLADALKQKDAPSVMLVFAPANLSYGDLRRFIAPVMESNLILYVFLQSPGKQDVQVTSP